MMQRFAFAVFLSSVIDVNGLSVLTPQNLRPSTSLQSTFADLGINTDYDLEFDENDYSIIPVPEPEPESEIKTRSVSILLCPAQFCVPADYQDFFSTLRSRSKEDLSIGTCRVAPLPRTEWIKVARQLPTKEFWNAELPVKKTLGWYFDAIEAGMAEIFAEEGEDANIAIVGHSIGGWVARAYLGGFGGSSTAVNRLAQKQVSSLVTLGTPHWSPDKALVDQTRGLLRSIEQNPACSSTSLIERGIDVTCVGSSSVESKYLPLNLDELVAGTSYFPLTGSLRGSGDGIVPLDLAFMEPPAKRVMINMSSCGNAVKHANVIPTPWNLLDGYAPSIALPEDFLWYGSENVVDNWVEYIR